MHKDIIKQLAQQSGLTIIENGVYGQRWYKSTCGLDLDEFIKIVEVVREYIIKEMTYE